VFSDLVSSRSTVVSSEIGLNRLFFNGAVMTAGSWIFRGSASFRLFRNEIGVTCTSTLSSDEVGECRLDLLSSSTLLQEPLSLSEPAITAAVNKIEKNTR